MHFFITGFMASGKTYWGRRVAEQCSLPFIDLDEACETASGITIPEYFDRFGELAFRKLETEVLGKVASLNTPHVIACGGGTPCSLQNKASMMQHGYLILIQEETEIILQRLELQHAHRPLLAMLNKQQLRERVIQLMDERKPCYSNYHFLFRPSSMEATTFVSFILNHV